MILNKVNQHKANKAAQSDALKQSVNQTYDSGQTGTSPMPQAPQPQQPTAPVQQTEQAPAMPADVKPEQPKLIKTTADAQAVQAQQRSVLNPLNGVNVNPQVAHADTPLERLSEKDFEAGQANGTVNFTDKQYWQKQKEMHPDSAYAWLKEYFADNETPEEKRKRERREQLGEVFRGLGNLIGNAANLYYTHRGGQYIDLNSVHEKHRERMQRLKDKQDALKQKQEEMLLGAKLEDFRYGRAQAEKKADWEREDKIRKEDNDRRESIAQKEWDFRNKTFEYQKGQDERKAKQEEEDRKFREEQARIANALAWSRFNFDKERYNDAKNGTSTSGSGSSSSGKSKTAVVYTPGDKVMDVDFGRINETTYGQLYNKVDDKIKEKYSINYALDDEKAINQKMSQAISEALMTQNGYADLLVKAGVGAYQQTEEGVQTNKTAETSNTGSWGEADYPVWQPTTSGDKGGKVANQTATTTQYSNPAPKSDSKETKQESSTPTKPVDKYQAMVDGYKAEDEREAKEAEDERKAREAYDAKVKARRIEKAKERNAKNLAEAEAERERIIAELNSVPERDIEKFIKDNNLSFGRAAEVRRTYGDDVRKRNVLLIRLKDVDKIISNYKN